MMDYHRDPLLAHWDDAERDALRSNHRHQLATHIRGLAAMALLLLKAELDIAPTGPLDKDKYAEVRHAMRHPDDPELDPSMQLFALVLRAGGWLGRRTDPIGPTVLMRGMLQVMTLFSIVNQFPDLIASLAKNYEGGRKNAYTW
jgi:hypothetical protein